MRSTRRAGGLCISVLQNDDVAYGVLFSKSGQVLVESADGASVVGSDITLDRFRTMWGAMWVPGRLTLTKLHLNFIPHRAGRGMAMMDINLREVTSVEVSAKRLSKVVSIRTNGHVVRIRCSSASQLAHQVSQRVEILKRTPVFRTL